MAGMFDNFNKPNTDIPSNVFPEKESAIPIEPKPKNPHVKPYDYKLPFTDYNKEGYITGYWWYEGDQLVLEFDISGEVVIEGNETYIPAEDFVKGKTITLKFYNFRGEEIHSIDYAGSTLITYDIDENETKRFHKGVYTCSLTLWNGNTFNRKIYEQHNCTLTVK